MAEQIENAAVDRAAEIAADEAAALATVQQFTQKDESAAADKTEPVTAARAAVPSDLPAQTPASRAADNTPAPRVPPPAAAAKATADTAVPHAEAPDAGLIAEAALLGISAEEAQGYHAPTLRKMIDRFDRMKPAAAETKTTADTAVPHQPIRNPQSAIRNPRAAVETDDLQAEDTAETAVPQNQPTGRKLPKEAAAEKEVARLRAENDQLRAEQRQRAVAGEVHQFDQLVGSLGGEFEPLIGKGAAPLDKKDILQKRGEIFEHYKALEQRYAAAGQSADKATLVRKAARAVLADELEKAGDTRRVTEIKEQKKFHSARPAGRGNAPPGPGDVPAEDEEALEIVQSFTSR